MPDQLPAARGAEALSKRCLDIGYFTNRPREVLSFWRDTLGLAVEQAVPYNDGLVQYRHALGDSILKINTAGRDLPTDVPGGYRELLVARAGERAPRTLYDPDGNAVTLVPPGYLGVTGVGLKLAVADLGRARRFYRDAMGYAELAADRYAAGDSVLQLEHDPAAVPAGHWVNLGLRYVTLHVRRVDASWQAFVAAGAAPGEAPYDIGRIARISFVRDPEGQWIEVAQRAALAGPWWTD